MSLNPYSDIGGTAIILFGFEIAEWKLEFPPIIEVGLITKFLFPRPNPLIFIPLVIGIDD